MDAPEKPDNLYSEDCKFQFIVPPEAPVFEPTREEFKDPLIYISKIRPIAEKHGICKIRPPSEWQPPFAVDVDNFVFTPRIQRLNELDGKTRVKLNFLDKLAKFWELQGSKLKIPKVENKVLDLPTLHRIVQEEGGLESVSLKKKWSKVAAQMGFFTNKNNGSLLKSHYERLLYPYDVFDQKKSQSDSTENISNRTGAGATLTGTGPTGDKEDEDYKPHGIPSRQAVKPEKNQNDRRAKRYSGVICESEPNHRCGVKLGQDEDKDNKELRRLQFYGAGPKMAGYNNKRKYADDRPKTKGKGKKLTSDYDPLAKYVCHNCSRGDSEETMLLCDGCDDSYHTFCLMPPLTEVPKGDWRCPKCVEEEVSKPVEAFGFEQAQREYSLQQFGEMADQFKSDYFRLPVHRVPTDTVEKEFWRIVSSIDEDVTVEYGADLHTVDHGSGFPTAHNSPTHEYIKQQKEYIESSWNLNNLPVVQGSVLGHINANISGMKVPWMYVGMCFATFCWHNEDHWSYSINYLHWGEPKTWYGVPGSSAEEFENAMKSAAPELFESQPDLLHQLVTIMNPNVLMDAGVPVFRTDQHAGEFVITFPRAYHAGFNQGYNFAEAVNFAPADWLKMGRECINHYSSLHRYCVFSHDELLCSMCVRSDALDFRTAAAAYQDVTEMVLNEEEMRKTCNKWGIHRAQQMCFELLADDERQCEECKTTCFLSAITCNCSNKLVCLRHYDSLCRTKPEPCKPEEHLLRYRYSLDELIKMKEKLRSKAETFTNWVNTVKYILENNSPQTLDFDGLKALLVEAEENAFPDSELLESLTEVIRKAEKCVVVAQQLDLNRVRTRTRLNQESKNKLRVTELELLDEEMEGLPCKLREADGVKHLLSNVKQFQKQAKELLSDDFSSDNIDVKSISKCIALATALDIELPELPLLRIKLEQCKWMVEYKSVMDKGDQMTADHLKHLIKSGENVTPVYQVEQAIAHLVHLLENVHSWEERAKMCLLNRSPRQSISHLENLLNESDSIKVHLPSKNTIRDNLKKGKEWNNRVRAILNCENDPYIELLDELVRKGRLIVVHLEMLPRLEAQLNSAHLWKERAARTFLLKNSHQTLMETISPRSEVGVSTFKAKRRSGGTKDAAGLSSSQCLIAGIKLNGSVDPSQVVAAFKKAENNEKELLKNLRSLNLRKRMNNSLETKYCVCKRTAYGFMLECALCRDWFHGSCVPLLKGVNKNNKCLASEIKFLCPMCVRSRRPKLETIVSLLVTLQKLAVRLPEGDALQCLTERAMSWQDKARKILSTDEMTTALAKLSVTSQQMAVDSSLRQKTDKLTSSEAWKSGVNKVDSNHGMVRLLQPPPPQLATDTNSSSSPSPSCQKSGSPVICLRMEEPHSSSSSYSSPQGEIQGSYSNSEHAYSSVSKTSSSTSKKHLRKSPLVPRVLEEPQFTLSQQGRIRLMEIMFEGDLMEVSLEETQQIWRILEATKRHGPVNNKCQDIEDLLDFPSPVIRRVESLDSDQLNVRRRGNNNAAEQSQVKRTKLAKDISNTKPSIAPVTDSFQSSNHKGRKQKLICMREDFDESVGENNSKRKMNNNEGEEEEERQQETSEGEDDDDEVDNETSEDDCAAGLCLHPSGSEVDWVQCDGGCEQWFHLLCVNLKKTDINEDDDYICIQCKHECQPNTFLVELTSSGNSMEIETIKDVMETCEPSASTCAANLCPSIWNERNVLDSPMELEDSAKERVQILSRSDEERNPDLSAVDRGVEKAQTAGTQGTQVMEGFSKCYVEQQVTDKSCAVLSTDVDL